ncbi:MAG: YitT family protein [Bilifractor sp.]|jgi:uncharacterized membrane-anchored protein YitT (DUF2179 family)
MEDKSDAGASVWQSYLTPHRIKSVLYISFSILIMAVGIYFFKFPNNFVFGGITGLAVLIAKVTPLTASVFTLIANGILLVIGWIFLGKNFAIKTGYASTLLSVLLVIFERIYPMNRPFSNQPTLELLFAIALPAISSAMLFSVNASSGGTDVVAMLLNKYTSLDDIGVGLFISDLVMIIFACFVFSIQTALYSFVGLVVKSLLIDRVIADINMRKAVMIICDEPEIIKKYITEDLVRGATILEGIGGYTKQKRYLIFTTLDRRQTAALRQFIREHHLHAFATVFRTSEVYGKGFLKM